ncbi:NAD(P)/FAD-dependent oxidoreductase [Reinekea thalattae]|uniref:FAD-dependent oxidoreductase n=1 Tax=Reinekea thalattae TaxID=2593301 RepID=A0A5C8Z1W4_9GAMM|nr:FAD-dependent oxidoreductase [Reinekea thalattae]TXR52142.1 FAD-dependent oxidoreductase [Reinekea thalattae]
MKNIAIIGSGISGLTTAYLLSKKHQVTLFEKNDYIGGHTATIEVTDNGQPLNVDTGFIVFNDRTYPNFLALLDEIGVGRQPTQMSFSVHNQQTGLEYNGHTLNTLFAQRRNIVRANFWRLIKEILRFNKQCQALYQQGLEDCNDTLGDFLTEHNFSEFFCEHYILPMGAAIWSASLKEMKVFELKFFIRFFQHHGLLDIAGRPQWYVIPGGSKMYIEPMIQPFKQSIQLNADIRSVKRHQSHVEISFADGAIKTFDEVVFACHSDQALELLADVSEQESKILGAIPYRENSVVLHTDTGMLPKRQLAWASWNYQLDGNYEKPASVTYNMNILQGLSSDTTYCVTLNQDDKIDADKVLRKFVYHHPVFNVQSIAAQKNRAAICGVNNTHFVGAYWYNGFHEDGVKSAVDVAGRFGCYLNNKAPVND